MPFSWMECVRRTKVFLWQLGQLIILGWIMQVCPACPAGSASQQIRSAPLRLCLHSPHRHMEAKKSAATSLACRCKRDLTPGQRHWAPGVANSRGSPVPPFSLSTRTMLMPSRENSRGSLGPVGGVGVIIARVLFVNLPGEPFPQDAGEKGLDAGFCFSKNTRNLCRCQKLQLPFLETLNSGRSQPREAKQNPAKRLSRTFSHFRCFSCSFATISTLQKLLK